MQLTGHDYEAYCVFHSTPQLPRQLLDTKRHRIVAIDRLVKNGHHYAIVYVLQSEHKSSPYTRCFSYDIIDRHHIQAVGTNLASLLSISVNALQDILLK